MHDIIKIVVHERQTLLRGWVISTLIVLPFTFLPTVLKYGFTIEAIKFRISDAIVYSGGFALLVVIVAVIHNYNNLVLRKKLFDRPAFEALDFYGRLDGEGSIVRDLETFLLGKIGNYYFRLNLVDPEKMANKIEIIPLIKTRDNQELVKTLKERLGFHQSWYLGKEIRLSDAKLDDSEAIRKILEELARELAQLKAEPMEVDEFKLENEM